MTVGVAATMIVSLAAVPSWAEEPTPTPQPSSTETTPSEPSSRKKAVDQVLEAAKSKAAKTGKRVEISERNTETITLYANPDGKTLRMELNLEPVRVKNVDGGGFTPIDTTLVEQAGVIKPNATSGSLTLSAGQDKALLKSQATAGAGTAKITTPSTLPKPTLKGDTATYADAYGKGRDLLVTATATGFRQQVIITERPSGPVTFKMPVALPAGLSFSKNAQGQPIIVGKDGKKLTEVRPTLLQDATAADANGPMDSGKVGKAAVSLDGDGKTLVFAPDAAFLADPAVTYPVTMAAVAADWWETHTGAGGLPAQGWDTFVNDKDYPDSWDNFILDRILVGKSNSGTVRWRSYIKFPDMPAEFRGLKVQNADLILWNHLSNDCGTYVGSGITTRRVTAPWDEATMTWNSQPSVTSTGQITEGAAYSPDCTSGSASWAGKEWDLVYSIDEIVQAWSDGSTNYGVQLTAGSESDITNWRRYRTDEAGGCRSTPLEACKGQLHPPILTVDFEAPTPPRLETVVTTSREPLTSIPEYEEALTKSVYVPELDELIEPLNDELIAANEGQRNGEGTLIGTGKLDPAVPDPGDSDDTSNSDGEDTTPARVLATEPTSGATDVSLDSHIRATFSEEIFGPEFVVKSSQGAQIQGTTTLDDTEKIATFTPTQPLHPGATYTVEISGAIDAWENEMAPYTWSFRTVDQAAGRWTFDEGDGRTAVDSSGNDHDARLNDTATWITGKSGNAVSNVPSQARIAASRSATQQGKAIEVVDETTTTSITYAQPDGKTFKTDVTAGPVRARQGGGWVPIDTTLAEQGGKLRPKTLAEGAVVEISTGGTDPFVKMSADGKSYALRWPTPLPKPTVKGSVATYTDAAGVDADLVVTALPSGFRHEVVLRQRPAKPLELRIGVDDEGLTLTEGKGGRLLLKGEDKKLVAAGTRTIVSDGNKSGLARRGKIGSDVVTKDGRTELVAKPDQTFLADAGTVYPVRVAAAVTLPLSTDVDVSTNDSDGSPAYPDNQYMLAGTVSGGTMARVHLRFDTTGLPGSTVTDATLSMNTIDSHNCGAALARGIQVARATGAWDSDNLYWANKPAFTTEDASTNFKGVNSDCAVYPDSMDWNVTGIVQDWAAGAANHGLVLKSPGEADVDNYRVFTSSEDTDFGLPPKLTVTTSGPASQPAVSAPAITPAQTVGGVTVTGSLTPQLAATVTDTAGGDLTGEFEVEHDPAAAGQGSGQIWAGASQAVASGGQVTVSVPAGKLTDGWKIRWRARAVSSAAASAWTDWQSATVDVPDPVSEPAVGALQVSPSEQVDGTTVTPTLTPALLAQVIDLAGKPLRAEFEVEHDPAAPEGQGTGQIWTGAADNVPAGTQASIAIPVNTLSDGWKVRWRARAVSATATSVWSDWQQVTVDVAQPGEEPLAQTASAVIRTDQSFTTAAWLRWSDKDGDYTVLEQRGTHQAPFRLGNTADNGLVFTFTNTDAADATAEGVRSGVEPPVDEWFHLAGVYDATTRTATLYLNGAQTATAQLPFPAWDAQAPLRIGAAMAGSLDEVQIYQRPFSADEVANVMAPAPTSVAAPAPQKTASTQAAAATGDFDYERINLQTCQVSGSETGHGEYDARIRELPYNSCWSSYLQVNDYIEDESSGRLVKAGCKAVIKNPVLQWACRQLDEPFDEDIALRFRATVVIHSYLGNATGTGVVDGAGTGIKPTDMKMFIQLDDFALIDEDGRVIKPGNQLDGLPLTTRLYIPDPPLTDEGCTTGDGEKKKDISAWQSSPYDTFNIRTTIDNPGVVACAFHPEVVLYTDSGFEWLRLPLFSQKVIDVRGQWVGIAREGDGIPAGWKRWMPHFRCDSLAFGAGDPQVEDRVGGCINTRSKRVFVMSASPGTEFPETAQHIKDALNPATNKGTNPPKREGEYEVPNPPDRAILGTELPKRIPGNWAAPVGSDAGEPLHRATEKSVKDENRRVFFGRAFVADRGDVKDFQWPDDKSSNYCKYYQWEKYIAQTKFNDLNCDEYPFASTFEGAKSTEWDFSIRAIKAKDNQDQGNALGRFYAQFRVGNENSFWVMIQ
ncbi:DNRLRE domain-containing protein [Nonomuraea antimicrobica]|uniref:DNRLRE domain-containing protein n=1 Tax=Nonomuraea antimicrobica TaxID=561173 RepID=UPI0031E80FBC